MSAERPGRNDPCHCGSGTKYKKCHLEQDEAARVKATAAAATAAAAAAAAAPAPPPEARDQKKHSAPKPAEASRKMAPAARRRSV